MDGRIQAMTHVRTNQFGFKPGRSTMDLIFVLGQLMEKYWAANTSLHLGFLREVRLWSIKTVQDRCHDQGKTA